MLKKLDNYDYLIRSIIAYLALIIDPRFGNDILWDSDVLSSKFTLLDQYYVQYKTTNEYAVQSLFEKLLDEYIMGVSADEEIIRFLRAALIVDKRTDPLLQCKNN